MKRTILFTMVLSLVLTATVAKADFVFGEPVNLKSIIPVIDPAHEGIVCLSYDGLEMYIASDRPGGSGSFDSWVIRRASTDDDWDSPENLGPAINSPQNDQPSSISSDGLTLYFFSSRDGGYGNGDMYVATRSNRNEQWGSVENLGPTVNSPRGDGVPKISSDGLELYFNSWRNGGYGGGDLYVSKRATANDPWGEPENLGPLVNSEYDDVDPHISPDGLILFFSGNQYADMHRPGGYGGSDLWMTRRTSHSDPWEAVVNLGPFVNGPAHDIIPCLSLDGSKLYFTTFYDSTWDNWQAPIIPTCDLNGDGIIDAADMCIVVDHWGENYPICDVGPMPWGNGTVDIEDLMVLADHLFEKVSDPALIAHWAFDETEGMFAADSVGDNNAVVLGGVTWQPTGGQIDGALQLDGVSGYAVTDTVLNPADGPFSVLAWVKGGAPGQVIISQIDGEIWLGTDAIDGNLMTGLIPPKTGWVTPQPLVSEANITDIQWHHVGFVWDGSYRILYVDDIEVAKDIYAQNPLKSANGGLYIGASKDLDAGSFFSGLIDDVRIYNRVVSP